MGGPVVPSVVVVARNSTKVEVVEVPESNSDDDSTGSEVDDEENQLVGVVDADELDDKDSSATGPPHPTTKTSTPARSHNQQRESPSPFMPQASPNWPEQSIGDDPLCERSTPDRHHPFYGGPRGFCSWKATPVVGGA